MALPKPPRVKHAALDVVSRRIAAHLAQSYGERLDDSLCHVFALRFHFELGDKHIHADSLRQSLLQYSGRMLDNRLITVISRQLASRQQELRTSFLHPYERPVSDEWVSLEVTSVKLVPWVDEDRRGQLLALQCLTGHPAGHVISKKVPENWLSWLAYQIGFSRRLQYDYEPTSFLGLRFWGLLKAADEDSDELDFEDWALDSFQKKRNQSIIKLRLRFDLDIDKVPESKLIEYTCPLDLEDYCADCTRSVLECVASPNRYIDYDRRCVVDGKTSHH